MSRKFSIGYTVLGLSLTGLLVSLAAVGLSADSQDYEQPPESVEVVLEIPENSGCGIAEPWQKISTPVDGYRCFSWAHKSHAEWPARHKISITAGVACFPEEEVDTAALEACN